jgi:release factor glutamine methyltransferase
MKFYEPAEDSFFMCEIVKKYLIPINKTQKEEIKILDMGTGSGIQAKNCIDNGINRKQITSVDINGYALKEAMILGVKTIKSNLFSKIDGKYHLIIFNPPYLPADKYDKLSDTTGGKKGDETIIKKLKEHLEKKGVCFLLTSSLTPNKNWIKIAENNALKIKQIAQKKLFQEELFIWEIILS